MIQKYASHFSSSFLLFLPFFSRSLLCVLLLRKLKWPFLSRLLLLFSQATIDTISDFILNIVVHFDRSVLCLCHFYFVHKYYCYFFLFASCYFSFFLCVCARDCYMRMCMCTSVDWLLPCHTYPMKIGSYQLFSCSWFIVKLVIIWTQSVVFFLLKLSVSVSAWK